MGPNDADSDVEQLDDELDGDDPANSTRRRSTSKTVDDLDDTDPLDDTRRLATPRDDSDDDDSDDESDDDDDDSDDEYDDLDDASDDEIDLVVAMYREDGEPVVVSMPKGLANDLDELITQLRRLPADGGAIGHGLDRQRVLRDLPRPWTQCPGVAQRRRVGERLAHRPRCRRLSRHRHPRPRRRFRADG